MKTSKSQLAAVKNWQRRNADKQAKYVRDWEKRNPEQAQARKNAYWKTPKGKAAIKRRRKKFNAYRRRWRAERAKAKAANLSINKSRRR
jgi:DNA-binding PadR family transcriptional regulator